MAIERRLIERRWLRSRIRCAACAAGTGSGRADGSFDAGKPDRFSGSEAGRFISKYLRPDGAKTSFVPLLEAVEKMTPRDPRAGRHRHLLRPVYVSPRITRISGVTMGFLRFCRRAFMALTVQHRRGELLVMYRLTRMFNAVIDGMAVQRMPQSPPVSCSLIPVPSLPSLTLF